MIDSNHCKRNRLSPDVYYIVCHVVCLSINIDIAVDSRKVRHLDDQFIFHAWHSLDEVKFHLQKNHMLSPSSISSSLSSPAAIETFPDTCHYHPHDHVIITVKITTTNTSLSLGNSSPDIINTLFITTTGYSTGNNLRHSLSSASASQDAIIIGFLSSCHRLRTHSGDVHLGRVSSVSPL